jgi:hypothetical protein
MAAVPKELEKIVEEQERFARLESRVEHVQADVTELKTDLRAVIAKLDALKDVISDIQAGRGLDKVWWMSIAGGLLAVMARGFKWI